MSFPSSPNYFLMQQWKECLCLNLTQENYQYHKQSHKQSFSKHPGSAGSPVGSPAEDSVGAPVGSPPPEVLGHPWKMQSWALTAEE